MKTKLPFVSERIAGMVCALACNVRCARFFYGCMVSGVLSAIKRDASSPAAPLLGYTKNAGTLVVPHGFPLVLGVDAAAYISQVGDGIIRPIAVYVVNVIFGPCARHVQPCQPVKPIRALVDAGYEVAVFPETPNWCADVDAHGRLDAPRKRPGLRVVVNQFVKSLYGKIVVSHDAVLSLIGQRPARVDSTSGLRYFSGWAV